MEQHCRTPTQICVYMGTQLVPLSCNIASATPHMAYLDGTTYSVSSGNLLITTIKSCQTFIIAGHWTLTMTMAPTQTVNVLVYYVDF
jgi:hypothetical protein